VKFTQGISLYEALPIVAEKKVEGAEPQTFEALNFQAYGYVFYESTVGAGSLNATVHDRGTVVQAGRIIKILGEGQNTTQAVDAGKIGILCEAIGRSTPDDNVFLGWRGIRDVMQGGAAVTGWTSHSLPLTAWKYNNLAWKSELPVGVPAFYRATFNVDAPADTFLNPTGLVRGCAFVNGFNLGAYWTIGPQITLYVRAQWLKAGENELVIFETGDIASVPAVKLQDTPILG
jgi:beta-galactosidase